MPNPAHTERAKVLYDIAPAGDNELALNAGDIVVILEKSNPDWWEAEHDGRTGFVPSTYVEILSSDTPPQQPPQEAIAGEAEQRISHADKNEEGTQQVVDKSEYSHLYPKARAIYDHTAADAGELSIKVGDEVTVYSWDDEY